MSDWWHPYARDGIVLLSGVPIGMILEASIPEYENRIARVLIARVLIAVIIFWVTVFCMPQ